MTQFRMRLEPLDNPVQSDSFGNNWVVYERRNGDDWQVMYKSREIKDGWQRERQLETVGHYEEWYLEATTVTDPILISEAARCAAKWWTKIIKKGGIKDNGVLLHRAMAEMNQDLDKKPTEGQLEQFEKLLGQWIAYHQARSSRVILNCDYHPGNGLYQLANYLGISESSFPWKTCMWVRPKHVTVKYGVTGPHEELFGVLHGHNWEEISRKTTEWDTELQEVGFRCSGCKIDAEIHERPEYDTKEQLESAGKYLECK